MDPAEAHEWLREHYNVEAAPSPGRAPSRDRIEKLLDLLDHPELQVPSIHLTGTNGKTSTTRMITSLLVANGLTVGSYTSPDLGRVNERICFNNEPIGDVELAEVLTIIAGVETLMDSKPNYFEVLAAAAFLAFAGGPVDAAVVEAGIGARWDATAVVQPLVSVVTNVGMDHAEYLGDTLEKIATEKSAVAKPGSILVCGETDPALVDIFEAAGADATLVLDRDFGVESNELAVGGRVLALRTPGGDYDEVFVPLHGAYQGRNAAVALAAAEAFFGGARLADDVVEEGFATVVSPGRLEVVSRHPLVVIDGAHNLAATEELRVAVDETFDVESELLVFGCMRDRDPRQMLDVLAGGGRTPRLVVACAADWPKARPTGEIVAAANDLGLEAVAADTVAKAVLRAIQEAGEDELVLVTGSLYVVGEARTALGLP